MKKATKFDIPKNKYYIAEKYCSFDVKLSASRAKKLDFVVRVSMAATTDGGV